MDRGGLLWKPHLPEPQHRPLSPERQVAVLHPVVGTTASRLLLVSIVVVDQRDPVGPQAVGGGRLGEPRRFSAVFMNRSAAFLSLVLVT